MRSAQVTKAPRSFPTFMQHTRRGLARLPVDDPRRVEWAKLTHLELTRRCAALWNAADPAIRTWYYHEYKALDHALKTQGHSGPPPLPPPTTENQGLEVYCDMAVDEVMRGRPGSSPAEIGRIVRRQYDALPAGVRAQFELASHTPSPETAMAMAVATQRCAAPGSRR